MLRNDSDYGDHLSASNKIVDRQREATNAFFCRSCFARFYTREHSEPAMTLSQWNETLAYFSDPASIHLHIAILYESQFCFGFHKSEKLASLCCMWICMKNFPLFTGLKERAETLKKKKLPVTEGARLLLPLLFLLPMLLLQQQQIISMQRIKLLFVRLQCALFLLANHERLDILMWRHHLISIFK